MSRDASVTFLWGDDDHTFRLPIGQLRELQEKTDSGPAWLYARIEAGMWRVDDLVETIRLGLIGGGAKPEDARTLVRRYVEGRPPHESVIPAQKILAAAIVGPEDEPLKKAEVAEKTGRRRSRKASSGSRTSKAAPL